MNQEKNLYGTIAQIFRSITDRMAERHPERKWAYEPAAKHWEDLYRAKERGKMVVWYNFATPPELFHSWDILVPQQTENLVGVMDAFPQETDCYKLIDYSHQYIPETICSVHKAALSALQLGYLPKPDLMISGSGPCDSTREIHSLLAGAFDIPLFSFDLPYRDDEASSQYLADQFEELVKFLEAHTGRKMDLEKLRQVIRYSNEAQSYILKISELRKTVPCPTGGSDLLLDAGVNTSLVGTREAVEYFRKRYETAKKLADAGKGYIPEEKIRLVYIYGVPLALPRHMRNLEKKYGAVVVADMFEWRKYKPIEDLSSRRTMLRGLARKAMLLPMVGHFRGPAEYFVDAAIEAARDYKVNAVIFPGGIACKNAWAAIKLVQDKIQDELGIPFMNILLDPGDARVLSEEGMESAVENFITTLM